MTEAITEVRCPKCNSNQITANKKGFSGTKAVVGGVLTGGVGLLAGTIGSNKVIITCLSCGHKFKPGEGKVVTIQEAIQSNEDVQFDNELVDLCKSGKKLAAVKYCMNNKKWSVQESKKYVDDIIRVHNIQAVSEGCFIATACYGDYDAPEVVLLRKYRDQKLSKTANGRLFIKVYYRVSPLISQVIGKSDNLKNIVRRLILQPIIAKL